MSKQYKRMKLRKMPGDVSMQEKVRMIEGKSDRLTKKQQKSYKKEHVKLANRRFRHKKVEQE